MVRKRVGASLRKAMRAIAIFSVGAIPLATSLDCNPLTGSFFFDRYDDDYYFGDGFYYDEFYYNDYYYDDYYYDDFFFF